MLYRKGVCHLAGVALPALQNIVGGEGHGTCIPALPSIQEAEAEAEAGGSLGVLDQPRIQ